MSAAAHSPAAFLPTLPDPLFTIRGLLFIFWRTAPERLGPFSMPEEAPRDAGGGQTGAPGIPGSTAFGWASR